MTQCKRVVSIGAHSLDAELLGGPLLIKYAQAGAQVTCSNVVMGRLEGDEHTAEEKEAYVQQVHCESEVAAAKLGGDCRWLGYSSATMPSTDEFADELEKWFEDEHVDLVITHWRGSMHPRHVATHDAVTQAVKKMRLKGSHIQLLYGLTFEDLNGFIPQAYFTLTQEEVDRWMDALSEYAIFRGEVNDFPYRDYYPTNLRVRDIESGSGEPTVCYMFPSLVMNELL